MFNLHRERKVGHHITLQESNSLRLADERMEDELARNILDFGETEDTVPTREVSIREEIVLEQDDSPVNLATSPDPAAGPTRLPRTGQLSPISGDLPSSNNDPRGPNTTRTTGQTATATGGNSARSIYRNLLTNVATLIGRAAEPTSPNTIIGALSSTPTASDSDSGSGSNSSGSTPSATPRPTSSAPARAQLSIITGGTQIQRNPPEVAAANGKMYQLTLTQAGINRDANFAEVLEAIKRHIGRASFNSFGGRAGNINFNNIVQVVAGAGGTIIARFPWADAQQANLREKITEALRNAQRGELLRLGQITLIELPGDVRGETAVTGGTGTTPAPTPAPVPLTSIPPPEGTTRAGKIFRPGGPFSDTVWEVEVRLFGQILQQGYTGVGSAEYQAGIPARFAAQILRQINQDFGNNDDNSCELEANRNFYILRYVPDPAEFADASTNPTKNYELYLKLRRSLDFVQNEIQSETPTPTLQLLLPFDRNYNIALPQRNTVEPTVGQRVYRTGAGVVQSGAQAVGLQTESYNEKNSLLSTRLQQLAGIIKEQANAYELFNTQNYSPAPPVSSGNVAQEPLNYTPGPEILASTMPPERTASASTSRTPTQAASASAARTPAQTAPAARSASNPNINAMIDRVIANARRIAPQVTQLASNPAYSANRQKLQQLAQYLTGEFISSMNAAKNAPDNASKLRAIQAIYTPPNRGALLRNGLFDLGRLAASERR